MASPSYVIEKTFAFIGRDDYLSSYGKIDRNRQPSGFAIAIRYPSSYGFLYQGCARVPAACY